jgi:hypothetical protein
MLAGFINSYMKWDGERRYSGKYAEKPGVTVLGNDSGEDIGLGVLGNK